jgi:sialidase-1
MTGAIAGWLMVTVVGGTAAAAPEAGPTIEKIDVFTGGTEGGEFYTCPALVVAPGGTLLAFCEARRESKHDASPADVVLKRSTDGGRTWGPKQTVFVGEGTDAIMNACPVVDGDRILVFAMIAHKVGEWRHRYLQAQSTDAGKTWSAPEDITAKVGSETFIGGPGVGIRLRSGRLVIPGYVIELAADPPASVEPGVKFRHKSRSGSHACVIYSDDGGRTWRAGRPVTAPWSNESQVVELGDGSLLLNWRHQIMDPARHPGCRGSAVSRDGGETWEPPVMEQALNEVVCQAGFIRWVSSVDGRPRLLFSNPNGLPGPDGGGRTRMTVKVSEDEGRTWPFALLIEPGRSAYSCPAALPDGTLALLYECGDKYSRERMRLARLTIDQVKQGTRKDATDR